MRAKFNIVISGGTGAGKTTLLNALSAAVPDGDRIITVEDNAELRLQQPHVVTLEARPANVEGKGEVTIRDLVRNSLRMRPDRIIVGEVRGAETVDMLQALNTGHEGSLVTLHSNSCDDAIHRLATLASMSELQIPFEALRDQINSAIDVIVQVDRFADGRRRVSELAVVSSHRRETFRLASVMEFVSDPIGPDRRVVGAHEHRQLPEAVAAPADAGRRAGPAAVHRRERRGGRRARGGRMTTASWALALLLFSGAVGVLGLWQLLAGTSRKAELAERGRAGANDSPGRNLVMALDVRFRRTDPGRRLGASLAGAGVSLTAGRAGRAGRAVVDRRLVRAEPDRRALAGVRGRDRRVDPGRARADPAPAGQAQRGLHRAAAGDRRGCWPTAPRRGSRSRRRSRMAGRELADPGGAELQRVVDELRLGQSLDAALGHLQDRLPSREVAVLMTTIVIQQRAGGDTVRALSELAGDARSAQGPPARDHDAALGRRSSRPTWSPGSAPRRSCC